MEWIACFCALSGVGDDRPLCLLSVRTLVVAVHLQLSICSVWLGLSLSWCYFEWEVMLTLSSQSGRLARRKRTCRYSKPTTELVCQHPAPFDEKAKTPFFCLPSKAKHQLLDLMLITVYQHLVSYICVLLTIHFLKKLFQCMKSSTEENHLLTDFL